MIHTDGKQTIANAEPRPPRPTSLSHEEREQILLAEIARLRRQLERQL